jgi:putative phosphoesterase
MRIAALYDIHGNLPALEVVLAEIREEAVDQIVVGGDVVPGPMPRECLAALLDTGIPTRFIYGNGERNLLAVHRGEKPARVPAPVLDILRWVADRLPAEQLAAFDEWPRTLTLDVPGLGRVLFCHATPRDENELFTRLTPEDRLRPIFEATGADIVVCGHTHMQFDRMIGDVRVVNAGSVGMPYAAPGAYWLLLESRVIMRRTRYDMLYATVRIADVEYPGASSMELIDPPSEDRMTELFESAASRGT